MPHTEWVLSAFGNNNMLLSSISSNCVQKWTHLTVKHYELLSPDFAKLIQVWEETFLPWSVTFPLPHLFFLQRKK